ncbi:MAG: hypothetical protein EOP08_13080 [Proteobacteria bacterium]|nr:MAG: hypothetical protein EOP08_13080 [Pseudomonadota bacterium]
MTLFVFSNRDEAMVRSLGHSPGDMQVESTTFANYEDQLANMLGIYRDIESYWAGGDGTSLQYDLRRRQLESSATERGKRRR